MDEARREQIMAQLRHVELRDTVRILYAAESGSRAWGFASPDSDYDVRFLYIRPIQEYLRLRPRRDVIELPIVDDLDINGWDIVKALNLFRSSNPPLLEWLKSPIIYLESGDFAAKLRTLAQSHFSPRRMTYHYLSMTRNNHKDYIADKSEVSLKKYLYAMRPLVCIRWMEQRGAPPPTSVWETLAGIELDREVRAQLSDLMERKQRVGELGAAAPDAILNRFIDAEIERITVSVANLPDPTLTEEDLNTVFQAELGLTLPAAQP